MSQYEKYTNLHFVEFLKAFVSGLSNKKINGENWVEIDADKHTKDRSVINKKVDYLETLMKDFLHIDNEDLEEINTLDFIRENVNPDTTEEDVELYSDMLDDLTLEVDNDTKLLDEHNRPSLIALVGYACENDIDLDEWIKQWFVANTMYVLNQKRNFEIMRDSIKKGAIA